MPPRIPLEIEVHGGAGAPPSVSLKDSTGLLDRFGCAVESVAARPQRQPSDCPSNGEPRPGEQASMMLAAVSTAPCVWTLLLNDPAARATATLIDAVSADAVGTLPTPAGKHLRRIWGQIFGNGWDAVAVRGGRDSGLGQARLLVDGPLSRWRTYRGGTTVYGECRRVGADDERSASLKVIDGSTLDVRLANGELAGQLRERLGEIVGLDGEATWDLDGGRMIGFRADALGGYRERDSNGRRRTHSENIRALADAAGGRWDDIDPEAYVRELREG